MPMGSFINALPPAFFILVHLAAFVVGAYFAYRSFGAGLQAFGWGFTLYAIAEVVYMTYHMDWTVFLFAHTIAEVLDLAAFALIFAGVAQRVVGTARAGVRP
ncbi:MAG TPA: hypothetical protein VGA61_18405 [Anaerolineae bacterium]